MIDSQEKHANFVHLRVHTAFSLSEGAIKIDDLVGLCREKRMPAVAITDTNNLFGGLEFSLACAEAGIQPIIGCQISVTRKKSDEERLGKHNACKCDSLVLLVQNDKGYRNLLKILGQAYLGHNDKDKISREPQVSIDELRQYNTGLLALSGGPKGPIGHLLADGHDEAAEALLITLKQIFSERFYIEILRHGIDEENRTETKFIDLAYKHDLPLVATNEPFFTTPDMYEAHDALICIAEGAYVNQTDRRRLSRQHYFKSAEEMRVLFMDLPEAVDNTLNIAKRCSSKIETIKPILPLF